MAFETNNPQLNFLMKRARRKNAVKNALKQEAIEVDTISEQRESESDQESDKLDIGGVSSASGIGVEPVGVSRSIEKAQEDINIASAMPGVGSQQTAGQIAFGMEKASGERSFMETDPVGAAITGYYDSALAQTAVNLAPAVAAYTGNIEAARALGSVSNILGSPTTSLITGVVGPSMQDPYGQNVAMGSGMLNTVASSVMSTHYEVADKMAQGIPGYNQGYYQGNLVSIEPGIFGGRVMTGVTVPSGSISDFEEAIKQAELQEDEDAISGYMQGNPAAMMQAGITADDYGSATQAAQAGIGYSSYDAFGNPTGAAPAGSQYSATGTFSTDDNNDSNDDNYGGYTDDDFSGFSDGGKIGMQMGGDPAQQQTPTGEMGFVGGPPDQFTKQQTIADDIPKTVPEGAFVINAPAVEFAGKEDIKQMLVEAYEIVAQADTDAGIDRTAKAAKIPSKEQVDIMISRGEVIVPPEIAKVIGYDRLEKINNRGKREVARRQEESQKQEKPQARQASDGGFIGMQEGGNTQYVPKTVPKGTYYTKEERDKADSVLGKTLVPYSEREKGVYRIESELEKSRPTKFSSFSSIREMLQNNPITPFNKGETETYSDSPLPPKPMTEEYKSGVKFGDTETGFQYLNQTGDNLGRQGRGFNDLLLAGLRDRRTLTDFVKLSDYGGVGTRGGAAGIYFPYFNKIAVARKNLQMAGIGTPGLTGDTEVHELMHKGADLLEQDPNFDWNVYAFGNKSFGKVNKLERGRAEHRYIQAVVNTAFIKNEIQDKTQNERYYVGQANKYLDYLLAEIEEDKKQGYSIFDEEDIADAKRRIAQREDKLETAKKTVMLAEITRVYNAYFNDEDRKRFNDAFIQYNKDETAKEQGILFGGKFENYENGIEDFIEIKKKGKPNKAFFSSQVTTADFDTDRIHNNFSLQDVTDLFELSNYIMINNEDTKAFLSQIERVAPKSTRNLDEMYVSPGQIDREPMAEGGISSGFIDYDALKRNYGTTNIDQIIQKKVGGVFGVREQGEKAQEIAYDFARENEFMDDDKSEDTLRHILGGGFMADEKLGFAVYNLKENPYVNMIYGGLKGFITQGNAKGFTLPTGEAQQEAEIDLNNNEFGKALRQKYPNEKEFVQQAKKYLLDMRAGKEVKPVSGFRPMMSLGTIQ